MRGRVEEKRENIREEQTLVGAEMPYTFRHKRCVDVKSGDLLYDYMTWKEKKLPCVVNL